MELSKALNLALGVIVRDEAGEFIAAMAMNVIGIPEAGHAELMAIWKGMELG